MASGRVSRLSGKVVRLFDGAIAALPCATIRFEQPCDECEDEETCTVRHAFLVIRNATVELLKADTLESLIKQETNLLRGKRVSGLIYAATGVIPASV